MTKSALNTPTAKKIRIQVEASMTSSESVTYSWGRKAQRKLWIRHSS